jgi:MFS family permease
MSKALGISRPPHQVVVVIAATIFMMCGFGSMATVGTFMKPLEAEFGWLRADMSFAYTLFSIGAAGGGLIWGHLVDRFDPRPIAVFGSVMIGGGLILLSMQSNLANIQLVYLLIGMLGFACLYSPVLATVGLWFDRRRARGDGVA